MEKELQRILFNIKQTTGIGCACVSANGVIIASSNEEYKEIAVANFDGIFQSVDENRTYFNFSFKGTAFIGAIDGSNEVSLNYAKLITNIIENNSTINSEQSYEAQFLSIITGETTRTQAEKFIEK